MVTLDYSPANFPQWSPQPLNKVVPLMDPLALDLLEVPRQSDRERKEASEERKSEEREE
jgi:hypothetical protein